MEYAEIYLDLSSENISGDATATDFKGMIELNDWAWGMKMEEAQKDQEGTKRNAVGLGVSIRKPMDGSTTALLSKLETGARLKSATLFLVQTTEVSLMVRLDFDGVVMQSYDLDVDSGDSAVELNETWTFMYEKVTIQYKGRGQTGGAVTRASTGAQTFTLVNQSLEKMEAVSLTDVPLSSNASSVEPPKIDEKELAKLVNKLVEEKLKNKK